MSDPIVSDQPSRTGISINTHTGEDPRIIDTAAIHSGVGPACTGERLDETAGNSFSPSSEISTSRSERVRLRIKFDPSKPDTVPSVSISPPGATFKVMASEVPLAFHPVSNIAAVSSAERMFLSILRKCGEVEAVRLARDFGFDISRFYPDAEP